MSTASSRVNSPVRELHEQLADAVLENQPAATGNGGNALQGVNNQIGGNTLPSELSHNPSAEHDTSNSDYSAINPDESDFRDPGLREGTPTKRPRKNVAEGNASGEMPGIVTTEIAETWEDMAGADDHAPANSPEAEPGVVGQGGGAYSLTKTRPF